MSESVQGPQSSQGIPPAPPETPQERKKIFELQWEIAVIGMFIASNQRNGSLKKQLDQIKNDLKKGMSPDEIQGSVNRLIENLNELIPSEKETPFPSLVFSADGESKKAANHFAKTLDKLLESLEENGLLETPFSGQIGTEEKQTPTAAFQQMQGVIDEVNENLPTNFQIPDITKR